MAGAGLFRDPPRRVGGIDDVLEDEKKRRMLEPNDPERVLCCGSPVSSTLTSVNHPPAAKEQNEIATPRHELRHQVNNQPVLDTFNKVICFPGL